MWCGGGEESVEQLFFQSAGGRAQGVLAGSYEWVVESHARKCFVDESKFGTQMQRTTRPVYNKKVFLTPEFIEAQACDSVSMAHTCKVRCSSIFGKRASLFKPC